MSNDVQHFVLVDLCVVLYNVQEREREREREREGGRETKRKKRHKDQTERVTTDTHTNKVLTWNLERATHVYSYIHSYMYQDNSSLCSAQQC